MNCCGNPTCEVTCRALCQDAVLRAQGRGIPYEFALELIIKSQPPTGHKESHE